MIYVDVSQVSKFLRAGKQSTGIQRLTANTLLGMHEKLGDAHIRAMIFDTSLLGFRSLSVAEIFSGRTGEPAAFSNRDSLLFMEWYWNQQAFAAGLQAGKNEGARIFRFIHDVIPVARPEFVRPQNSTRFRANTLRALAAADVVLTNSEFSKIDILKHFPAAAAKPLHVLPLPDEFSITDRKGKIIPIGSRTEIALTGLNKKVAALQGEKFVLMVGTLEARKNTLTAIKTWQHLHRKHGSKLPKLVLVGTYSAHSIAHTIALALRAKMNTRIVHFSSCNDLELAWLYQRCLFTMYISQYEGWGLPIGESLWFEKPVLIQNNSSLPEVGRNLADIVEPQDRLGREKACEKLCFEPEYRQTRSKLIQSHALRSRQNFVKNFLDVIVQ